MHVDATRSRQCGVAAPRHVVVARVTRETGEYLKRMPCWFDVVIRDTDDDFFRDRTAGAASAMLWELGAGDITGLRAVPDQLLHSALSVPILIRGEARGMMVREIMALADAPGDWRVSLVGFDDLLADIGALTPEGLGVDAHRALLRATVHHVDPTIRELLTAAILAGKRRLKVGDFAAAFGWRPRAMELRSRKLGIRGPGELLAWSLLLHTAWRIERLEMSPKRAAHLAGYQGPAASAALGEYVYGHLGLRPTALSSPGTFAGLLHQFLVRLSAAGQLNGFRRQANGSVIGAGRPLGDFARG